jgi:NADH-quinone oxidoreductase subunit C
VAENLPHRTPSTAPMQTVEWDGELSQQLRAAFPTAPFAFLAYLGQNFVSFDGAHELVRVLSYLRHEHKFDVLTDLTAVDRWETQRLFEVVYILYSFDRNEYLRIKVQLKDGEGSGGRLQVPSVVSIWPGADWLEREVYDMFGIHFVGHPDLKRILMPDEWRGFPLRKDYSIIGVDQKWVEDNLGIEQATDNANGQ